MTEQPVLSIIIPVYNGEKTIGKAIESILCQNCSYAYEIIVVDDASTDDTINVVTRYLDKGNIIILRNENNMGNAGAFHKGLTHCTSKYWAVLDADDYYSKKDKLQIQLDFLERDQKEEYVGVAHNYITDYGNGLIDISNHSESFEFDYDDFIMGKIVYCHTATYMYRNYYKGNVPDYLQKINFRGDTIRTALALKETRKKIKVLSVVASVYNKTGEGIWSSLTNKKRLEKQLVVLQSLKDISTSERERSGYNYLMFRDSILFRRKIDNGNISIFQYLSKISEKIHKYIYFNMIDVQSCSTYYDSIVESLNHMLFWNIDRKSCKGNIVIFLAQSINEQIKNRIKFIISEHKTNVRIFDFSNSGNQFEYPVEKIIKIFDENTFMSSISHYRELSPSETYIFSDDNYFPFVYIDEYSCNHVELYNDSIFIPGRTLKYCDFDHSVDEQTTLFDLKNCYDKEGTNKITSILKETAYYFIDRMLGK